MDVVYLSWIAERLDVGLAGLRLAGAGGGHGTRMSDVAVAHVLDRGVHVDLVAGVDQRVGQIGRHLECAASAHAGAGHALQALGVAGG